MSAYLDKAKCQNKWVGTTPATTPAFNSQVESCDQMTDHYMISDVINQTALGTFLRGRRYNEYKCRADHLSVHINLILIHSLHVSLQSLFVLPQGSSKSNVGCALVGTLQSCTSWQNFNWLQWCSSTWQLAALSMPPKSTSKISVRMLSRFVTKDKALVLTCYALQTGGQRLKDVGASWPGGYFWGFPSEDLGQANNAKPQANFADFAIGQGGLDYYDLSNVNGYNLPLMINPTNTNGDPRNGAHCGTLSCTISDLNGSCKAPNRLTGGPGNGCYSTDGGGSVPPDGTRAFKAACPNSYSYFVDDLNPNPPVVLACKAGSDYEVIYCP